MKDAIEATKIGLIVLLSTTAYVLFMKIAFGFTSANDPVEQGFAAAAGACIALSRMCRVRGTAK